ncbi:hypothetical protein [Winogradskyella sp.]|uniref:hypothetical protein n=1 Tax=Winogradskyella sp. TaxID=1883156 RepID=UPI002626F42D|nr:hypothetical protein [Winogradskyella sp.]
MTKVEYPFTDIGNGHHRPYLPIIILNPKTGQNCITRAILDTGADDCMMPLMVHQRAGFKVDKTKKPDGQVSGIAGKKIDAWKKTMIIQLLDKDRKVVVKTTKPIKVDCVMINQTPPLLGTKTFLHDIKVTLDYPKKTFTLEWES